MLQSGEMPECDWVVSEGLFAQLTSFDPYFDWTMDWRLSRRRETISPMQILQAPIHASYDLLRASLVVQSDGARRIDSLRTETVSGCNYGLDDSLDHIKRVLRRQGGHPSI